MSEAAAQAFRDLAATIAEIDARFITAQRSMHTAEERAGRRLLVANALHHALECWFPADPERPLFQRWLSPTKKLLGDNPDALYYGAIIDPRRSYRIRGNLHGACYTSFAVEAGARDGHLSKGVLATLNDDQFEVAADGSYEIIASAEPGRGTGSASTRAPAASPRGTTGNGSAAPRPTRPSTCLCGSSRSTRRGRSRRWTTRRSQPASGASSTSCAALRSTSPISRPR